MSENQILSLAGKQSVSRRQLLQGAAITVGGAAMVMVAVTPAEAKMAQAAAGYQATAKNGQSCASCTLFKAPSSCTLVDGTISPDGWCRFYAKKS
jgi:secreted PhoX family phosphatase